MDDNEEQNKLVLYGNTNEANKLRKEVNFNNYINTIDYLWNNNISINKRNPGKFLFVLVIASEPSNTIDEIWNQWDFIDTVNYDNKCICSKDIHIIFRMINNINGNIIYIGIECIKKFMDKDNPKFIRAKMMYKSATYQGNKIQCKDCGNHRISEYSDFDRCKPCYEEYKQNKETKGPPIKYYLNVPYSEKDIAKSKGAKWDLDNKKWYCYEESLPYLREYHGNMSVNNIIKHYEPKIEIIQLKPIKIPPKIEILTNNICSKCHCIKPKWVVDINGSCLECFK